MLVVVQQFLQLLRAPVPLQQAVVVAALVEESQLPAAVEVVRPVAALAVFQCLKYLELIRSSQSLDQCCAAAQPLPDSSR
jgi:hypothetical protein